MGRAANNAVNAADTSDTEEQNNALDGYGSSIDAFNSNVNSALAAGNPYESKDYLTQQNLATSGAMNSANTTASQQLRANAARTGENSASTAAAIASNARAGQRDLTQYNATRDTENQDKWQQEKQQLYGDQLAGAGSEAGMYGTATTGRDAALGDDTSLQNEQDQMWASILGNTVGAAGTAASKL